MQRIYFFVKTLCISDVPSFNEEDLEFADVGGAEYTVVGLLFVVKGLKSAPTGPLDDELLCDEVTL